jgi:hypothetical protein
VGGFALGRIISFIVLIIGVGVMGYMVRGDEDDSGGLASILMWLTVGTIPKNSLLNLLLGLPFERAI